MLLDAALAGLGGSGKGSCALSSTGILPAFFNRKELSAGSERQAIPKGVSAAC